MKVDILIKNGRLIDPKRNLDQTGDLYLKAGKIFALPEGEQADPGYVLNAAGCLVIPGMIDYHEHVNYNLSEVGIPADLATLPKGVTTVVDCGTSGPTNCLGFIERLNALLVKSRLYIHISPLGLSTRQYYAPLLPEKWDLDQFDYVFEKGGEKICGIKMRVSTYVLKEQGMRPFFEMLKVAEHCKKNVLIHPSDPPVPQREILNALRPGDVYCHTYQGKGHTILDGGEKGRLIPELFKARERGVIFDIAHGGGNFDFEVAERAMEQGFLPDMISTDMTKMTWNKKPVCNLPYVMSKFLMLGMPLMEVIRCVTETPARALGMENRIGTLAPGACGDVAVLRVAEGDFVFNDTQGHMRTGQKLLYPVATFVDGMMVYQDPLFSAEQEFVFGLKK